MHLACPFLRVNLDNASIFRTAGAQRHYFLETNDACSPNTVHIVFDLLWHVKVDHLKEGQRLKWLTLSGIISYSCCLHMLV